MQPIVFNPTLFPRQPLLRSEMTMAMEAGEIDSPRLVLTIDQLGATQLLYSES